MSVASRQSLWKKNQSIMDDALFWFDGIMNAGKGQPHASSSNTWVNLGKAGTAYNALRNKDQASTQSLWTEKSAQFTSKTAINQWFCVGSNDSAALNMLGASYTIGCTFAVQSGWRSNYSGILGSHAKWNNGIDIGLVFGQYENGNVGLGTLFRDNDSPGCWLNGSTGIRAADFTNGEAVNMVFVCSPSRRAIFINGVLKAEMTSYADPSKITLTNDFHIGSAYASTSFSSTDRTFVGDIYDVYAWSKPLDDVQIAAVAQQSLSRFAQA